MDRPAFSAVTSTPVRKFLFGITFVLSTIVCLLFWALFFIDPRLVIPKGGDQIYPFWLSLLQHLVTFLVVLVELLVNDQHNMKLNREIAVIGSFVGAYILWMNVIAFMDRYPYPFQNKMNWIGHLIFNSGAIGLTIGVMFLKRYAVSKLWPQVSESHKKLSSPHKTSTSKSHYYIQ